MEICPKIVKAVISVISVDYVNETELDKKALELVLEDFLSAWNDMKAELAELQRRQDEMVFQTTGVSL